MGYLTIRILLLTLVLALTACDQFELRGFFTSYESPDERFEQSMEWNQMNGYARITIPNKSYSLHAMVDSHVGSTVNWTKFIQLSREEQVAAVILAGDLTTGHKEDYEVLAAHLPLQDSLRYFAMVGNHDIYFEGWKSFYSLFGSSSYYFVVNTPDANDLFICLDTGGGTLGGKQLAWFKSLLETERNNFRYCVVFTHNNLFRMRPTTSTNPMVEEIHVILDLLTKHDVNFVITGHDHIRNSAKLGTTTHIIMDALIDSNKRAGYLQLIIGEEMIEYNFKDID